MTLGNEEFRTNDFQQRQRLRLQQVREQSKDIAKKIRQRARVEKIRHVLEVDSKKEKDYFECQEKLVKRLEQLYSQGVENLGLAHKDVFENTRGELIKKDLSKLRGKEAAAILRKEKQEKLNEQKKLLDRKLKAREIANEFSREKSTAVVKSLEKSSKIPEDLKCTTSNYSKETRDQLNNDKDSHNDKSENIKNDMATQWEVEELPKEWTPTIPSTSIPNCDSVKDSVTVDNEKSNRSKKIDLFALSDEMTLNINGGHTKITPQHATAKPSLTLISEYLQNRSLRLRQNEPSSRKKTDDLQSIKQTILRTRATKKDGRVFDNVCHVLDEQIIPVPSWQAETHPPKCKHVHQYDNIPISPQTVYNSVAKNTNKKGCLSSQLNKRHLKSPVQFQKRFPVIDSIRTEYLYGTCVKTGNKERLSPTGENENIISKKGSVTVYNHNTKDARAMPHGEETLVFRDHKLDDDAYSQALKETSVMHTMEKEQINKIQQDLRNKVAIQKQSVDNEYKETLAFLNSLPKDKAGPGNVFQKTAYMNEEKEKILKERRQRKLQEEYKKIEKENNRHNCKHSSRRSVYTDRDTSKSKSHMLIDDERDKEQYTWMPVPESDGSLAIHTVPNIVSKQKAGNMVKFSHINSYHEYRSRHKHTPPTKDSQEKQKKRVVETVVLEQNESSDCNESTPSEHNSVDELNTQQAECSKSETDKRLLDADRIIIYKIIDSKKKKKSTRGMINKSPKRIFANNDGPEGIEKDTQNLNENGEDFQNSLSYGHLKEGVYKAVNSKGDNMTTMYFSETVENQTNAEVTMKSTDQCNRCTNTLNNKNRAGMQQTQEEREKNITQTQNCMGHKCCASSNTNIDNDQLLQASTATSTSSFKTASNEKGSNAVPDGGFIKFIDGTGKDSGKLYIGASGFLKDDNFEVFIKLRKKDSDGSDEKLLNKEVSKPFDESSKTIGIAENTIQAQDEIILIDERKSNPIGKIDTAKESVQADHVLFDKNSKSVSTLDNEKHTSSMICAENTKAESIIISELPNVCDKAVHTSFQDAFAIPDHVSKSDPTSRPATSTYTQTTFSSPMPRPAYMHMSSSTSTAYMSPPELILPRFLKQDYIVTSEEMYDSGNCDHPQDRMRVTSKNYCNHDESKMCKYCDVASKGDTVQRNYSKKCSRKFGSTATKTPPNTARSLEVNAKTSKRKTCKKTKCHKCGSHSEIKKFSKSNKNDHKHISNPSKSTGDIPHGNLKYTEKYFDVQSRSKSHLDPVTKEYVNKLLSLKKEGLKAIEIINQDCSSVTTPGSSIINVTSNKDCHNPVCEKISLEEIKTLLKRKILQDYNSKKLSDVTQTESSAIPATKKLPQLPRKRTVHKVKSLNISKRMIRGKKINSCYVPPHDVNKTKSSIPSTKDESSIDVNVIKTNKRSKSYPTPRRNNDFMDISNKSDPTKKISKFWNLTKYTTVHKKPDSNTSFKNKDPVRCMTRKDHESIHVNRATTTITSSDSEKSALTSCVGSQAPITITTQTNGIIINNEINYMKIAEDKLQNMEKIADLTDKCTKRLSNLAKVLEEVRRNKSLVYSQISSSDSTPDPEGKSDFKQCSELFSIPSSKDIFAKGIDTAMTDNLTTPPKEVSHKDTYDNGTSSTFVPLLINIPKPNLTTMDSSSSNPIEKSNIEFSNSDHTNVRYRGKPPVALSRIYLKQGLDAFVTPHELSTVIEVDSPMSLKTKNQSSHRENRYDMAENNNIDTYFNSNSDQGEAAEVVSKANHSDQHFQLKNTLLKNASYRSTTDSSCESKIQMMDMKQFNNIMLKPFLSIQEYAKQCNIGIEEGSNIDSMLKDNPIIDDITSFNSDSSLPDVIGELLKRNVISEPFKFDTGSNNNSTAMSSESTLSVLALSKVYRNKMVTEARLKHRKDVAETSDTMSISSNPDLENAFQKLGMGWASSTLKKTKERLALTSSSSTSSSSLGKFKIRSFKQNMPEISTDSVSSLPNLINKDREKITHRNLSDAVQQTSLSNSMTVKEFLTNELAKKITFTNKSHSKDAEVEFVSLYETKMPEEMKNTRLECEEDQSMASVNSANNNRARTSTPVQIFKSTTYRSSSSSNTSNGLFSNADDLSSVKVTSASIRNHSTSDKEDLTIPNYSLKIKKTLSDHSKSD